MAVARLKSAAKRKIHTQLAALRDGWENITTGHGTARDKRSGGRIKVTPTSNTYSTFEDMYHGDDIGAKIANKPPSEMVKKWISLSIDPGEIEDRNEARTTASQIAADMLTALDALKARSALKEAMTWARAYGGALIVIGADDGGGSQATMADPLNENRVREIRWLMVFDRFELRIKEEYPKGHPKFGRPMLYELNTVSTPRGQTLHGEEATIHESRVLRFDGPLTSRRRQLRNDGWNDSIYIKVLELLSDFGISWAGAAHLLSDFAPAVFKMKNLDNAVMADEGSLILDRLALMDVCRSTIRMTPIDSEDEDFARQATPVSGLPELLELMMVRMAGAADMPATVLFGKSPSGQNATGESDLTLWYDTVESMQETILRTPLERLIDLLFKSASGPTRGRTPAAWDLQFNPLWQLTQLEQIEARKTQMETDTGYIDTGVLNPDEVSDSRFGGETYSFETQIDTEAREEPEPEPEPEPAPAPPTPAPEPAPE